jgi:hypothetical protein
LVLRKMRDSVIFAAPCFILIGMKTAKKQEPSGKALAGLASLVGLALVWSIVWANLPSREELLSAQPPVTAAPAVTELDLSIPGVSAKSPGAPAASNTTGAFSVPREIRAKQIAEVKCEAEGQRLCPDALTGEARQQCMAQRMKQLSAPCRQIVQQRMVRWKEAGGYTAACAEDVKRVCQNVQPGDGNVLVCLQEHEQDLSESCYLSLPKGHLLLRN